jgi:hypothetical protein
MLDVAPKLNPKAQNDLDLIEVSVLPSGPVIYPCSARMLNGATCECVYFVEIACFKQLFRGLGPESMRSLLWISGQEVIDIEESPARLPARFANKIYQAGEHWGSYSFTLIFSWWCRPDYLVGGFIDFLTYPSGRRPADVKEVILYRRHKRATPVRQAYWCVFSR